MSDDGPNSDSRQSVSSIGVESALWLQCRNGTVVGGGRCVGRYGWLVLGLIGWLAMMAAREHFVNTAYVSQGLLSASLEGHSEHVGYNIHGLTFPCSVRSSAGIKSILNECVARRKFESTGCLLASCSFIQCNALCDNLRSTW